MNFFAYLARTKNINRWSLMRNNTIENVAEHSYLVTVFAHALCRIENNVFGGNADELKVLRYALYHDVSEVLTGDMPTPIKYFNHEIKDAYKQLEAVSNDKLVSMLPQKMQQAYHDDLFCDETSKEYQLVKIADKLSAYVKCVEETASGNNDFAKAKQTLESDLKAKTNPALKYFLENFEQSFALTLDELD